MRKSALLLLAGVLVGCVTGGDVVAPMPANFPQTPASPESPAATLTPLVTSTPTLTHTPIFGPTSTPTPMPTPFGCAQRPIDDMRRVQVREWVVSQRTLSMLLYAQSIYDGPNDLLLSLTQGSYHPGVDESFGTHDAGGAVDLSIYNQGPEAGRLDEVQIQVLVEALRRAGFAAWYRDLDDLYSGSPPHVHAVAIGDPELSQAAEAQLTGPNGYFRGRDGLPDERGGPDEHGGPIICPWMVEMGYADLRHE